MKKLMCAIAAVSAGICFADVESANIVGYNSISVNGGSTTGLGVQFKNVGTADEAGVPIKNLLTVDKPLGATAAGNGGDEIWVYENGDWAKYFWYVKRNTGNIWCSAATPSEEVADTVVLKPGQSFFFVRGDGQNANVTLSGEVLPLAKNMSYNVNSGSTTAMAYPWPIALKIKDFSQFVDAPLGATAAGNGGDEIWVYENGGWAKYFYYVKRNTGKIWCSAQTPAEEVADTVVLKSGQAFFFVRGDGQNGVITFK